MNERIGPYDIQREIGRGGMGVVYLANDTRLDRQVAIKAMPTELASDPVRLERFEREAKTLASLNHPNLAGIYGVEEQEGARYLLMEYVEDVAQDRDPKWSPDGRSVSFFSNRDGQYRAWTVGRDSAEIRRLDFGETRDVMSVSFSPDGTKARLHIPGEGMRVADIDDEGGLVDDRPVPEGLIRGPGSWSPDSRWIVEQSWSPTLRTSSGRRWRWTRRRMASSP